MKSPASSLESNCHGKVPAHGCNLTQDMIPRQEPRRNKPPGCGWHTGVAPSQRWPASNWFHLASPYRPPFIFPNGASRSHWGSSQGPTHRGVLGPVFCYHASSGHSPPGSAAATQDGGPPGANAEPVRWGPENHDGIIDHSPHPGRSGAPPGTTPPLHPSARFWVALSTVSLARPYNEPTRNTQCI